MWYWREVWMQMQEKVKLAVWRAKCSSCCMMRKTMRSCLACMWVGLPGCDYFLHTQALLGLNMQYNWSLQPEGVKECKHISNKPLE